MEYIQEIKAEIFDITNEVRQGFNLRPVVYSKELDRMGQIHTNEMYNNHFFSHKNPYCKLVETLTERMKYCGLYGKYTMYGENLADYPAEEGILIINPFTQFFNGNNGRPLISANSLCRKIIKGWYNSPGHRANLLCPEYDSVGFGLLLYPKICSGIYVKYLLVTQNFGRTFKS